MNSLRFWLLACVAVLAVATQGCTGGSNGTGTGGSAGGSGGTTGAAGTTGGGGTTGAGGTTGGAGTTGSAGTTGVAGTTGAGGSAGATGVAGSSGGAGATGAAGSSGSTGAGGSAGAAGRGGAGGSGGTGGANARGGTTGAGGSTGAAGTTGTGGATTPHGSAAKFICPQGQTYGNPLTGIGSVQQIAAPTPDYFAFIEGPVWIGSVGTGTLFFSDNASQPTEKIWKVVPPSTTPTTSVATSGSNGLAVDNNDQIVAAVQRSPYGIARFNPMTGAAGAKVTTTAKPNDVIVRSDDNIYFTDPDSGFYRISPTGTVSAAMKPTQGSRPNGIVLSLDENTLYVGDVGNKSITKYTLAADGSVMTSTMANFATAMRDTVDGMCVDCAGNIYAGTSGGVEVYAPTGSYIGLVQTGESSNCTFGGADRKTMYVTSRSVLKYVTLAVPGLPN